jgi:Glycosyltransferase family 9 (heptosyltransferase)
VKQVLAKSKNPPLTDCYIQSMSLPYLFGTTAANVPCNVPYLYADQGKASLWRARMPKTSELRVGIVWRGNPSQKNDKTRSCPFEELAPLATLSGVLFHSLQVGAGQEEAKSPPEGMRLSDFTEYLNDFSDTAAMIANLDLVIGVDTAVIHLAGALGKPVWALLAHIPEWRWLLEWDSSPWYPNMRLFRQEQAGDWAGVMMRVRNALELMLAERAY